ncbi:MAG: uncharacterized protein KVP18_003424 [Porospora cf. gigantea A]|nr:MAG: hypothetical protein KVP18_003424 [Porospora cf. gigantea A]
MARRMGKGRIRVLGTQDTGCSMPDASYSLDYVFLHCSRQDGNLDEHDFVNAKGEPGSPQLLPRKEEERFSLPTRHNIMLALNWLVRDVRQHDSLVFYFSGHGVQIDNMSGWEGEGYDEAILPWDFLTYGGQLNPITCLHLREILTDISEQCQLSIFLDCTGGQTLLDPTGTGSKMRFVKGLKQKGIWPITNPTDKVYRATYNPSTWKHPSMFEKHVRPRFVPGAEVDNTKDLRESSLQKQEVGLSTTFKAFQLSAAVWNQVVVEAKLPSLGIKAVGVKGLVADGTATVPNKPVVHGFFTWCLVRAMQTLVLEKVNMETKRIVKSFTFKQLNDRVAEIAAKAQVSQKLSKLEQINSLTVHTPSGSDPMREYVFYPLRSAFGAGLPYGRFSSKHVKESPFPYVPDLVQWFSAQHAEEYLIHYQKQKLKRDYFAREPSIASRLAHPHPMPSYWLKKVPDRPAFLTSPIGSLSPSVINHEGNPVYSPTPRRMGGCMQANCRM